MPHFLEAINVTLNVLDKHYMDRDLTRTGNSIVMISAGAGVFEVGGRRDRGALARIGYGDGYESSMSQQ